MYLSRKMFGCSFLLVVAVMLSSPGPGLSQKRISRLINARSPIPTVTQIVERFIQAVGGRVAWSNIKTQHGVGTMRVLGSRGEGTFEVFVKTPNKSLAVFALGQGLFKKGFDGEKSWTQTPTESPKYDGPDVQAISRRDSDSLAYLHFHERFPKARVTGVEKIEESNAYTIDAIPVDEKLPIKLYFNVESGLLVRRDTIILDAAGKPKVTTQYYDDYREVGGFKFAYRIRTNQGNAIVVGTITEMKINQPMEDAIFNLPTYIPAITN